MLWCDRRYFISVWLSWGVIRLCTFSNVYVVLGWLLQIKSCPFFLVPSVKEGFGYIMAGGTFFLFIVEQLSSGAFPSINRQEGAEALWVVGTVA